MMIKKYFEGLSDGLSVLTWALRKYDMEFVEDRRCKLLSMGLLNYVLTACAGGDL